MTYIALLRGINVSGHKMIKMELLRKALTELDFQDIRTYIQSGNVVFEAPPTDARALETLISRSIYKHFSFDVPVVVLTLEELETVVAKMPFTASEIPDPTQPYVAFLSEVPTSENTALLSAYHFGKDRWAHQDKTLYLLYADSPAKTNLTNVIIESKLKVRATSRNWKTILKLIEMAKG